MAAWWFYSRGYTLYYGDAAAHLRIARQIIDSRTPGYEQIGTVWLPLLHAVLIPFVQIESWWRSGLAGVFPSAISFVIAAMCLYFTARRCFGSTAAAVAGVFAFALNPNLLYLQSIPMTEALFLACQLGMIAALTWFSQSQSRFALTLAAIAGLAGTMVRYDGWFLLPLAALIVLATARKNRLGATVFFCAIVSIGPIYWLLHNRWFYSHWLEFYNGPYSHKGIYQRALDQGMARYRGDGDWSDAVRYYSAAARLCTGLPLLVMGAVGLAAALWRKAWAPLVLMAAVPLFYIASMHGGGTPIFVPHLWPNSYYNTRYGLAVLPLAAFAAAGLVSLSPQRLRGWTAAAVVLIAASPWYGYPRPENWITLKESMVNSEARRGWTTQAAAYFQVEYGSRDGVFSSFGDQAEIYRKAGIPLREVLHEGNGLIWQAALANPEVFLWQKWVVAISGDAISNSMQKAVLRGRNIRRVKIFKVSGAPPIEIYRNDNSLRQGSRRP